MENIKFIKKITENVSMNRNIFGNCIYYYLENGNRAKTWCDTCGVWIEIVNVKNGKVDDVYLPFANYFDPVRCSNGSPTWYQHIDNEHWYFENQYKHVLPKDNDYVRLASAIESYIDMFK